MPGSDIVKTVAHEIRAESLEVDISGLPKWKEDIYKLVAQLIAIRLKQKLSQKELAERISVNQSVVARFEKLGRIPTFEFLCKVAGGLGLELEIYPRAMDNKPVSKSAKRNSTKEQRKYLHHSVHCS